MPCKTRYVIVAIAALCYISRIPFLISPQLFLDGDECVTALMARAMLEGKNFSWFFWGQNYGFAALETIAIIPFYLLLGYTTIAVKLGVLSIWTTGVVFLYKTLVVLCNKNTANALLLTVVFIWLPAWGIYATKAWAGSVSAFSLSATLCYLLLDRDHTQKIIYYILMGILLELVYEAQKLWLAGIIPLLYYRLLQERSLNKTLLCITSAAVIYIGFYFYKMGINITYRPPVGFPEPEHIRMLAFRFPEYLYNSLCGNYYFNDYGTTYLFNAILAVIISCIYYIIFLVWAYQVFITKNKNYFLITSSVFTAICYLYTFLSYTAQGRYLLPVTGFLFIPLCILLNKYLHTRLFKAGAWTLIICGMFASLASWNYHDISVNHKKAVFDTINYCYRNDIWYTYSTDCMLPWQIMFYSDLQIMSRMPYQPSRYQPYSDKVDNALNKKEKVAVLICSDEYMDMNIAVTHRADKIAVSIAPPRQEIVKAMNLNRPE